MTATKSGLLWRQHEATPRQQRLRLGSRERRSRPTQADLLIAMLREARAHARPLELPEIMDAGIAQHGARFNELRARGFVNENDTRREAGAVRSQYWLRHDPGQDGSHAE